MMKWTVYAVLPGGMGSPRYEGKVTVHARTYDDAIKAAERRIRDTHGPRKIRVEKVEVEP